MSADRKKLIARLRNPNIAYGPDFVRAFMTKAADDLEAAERELAALRERPLSKVDGAVDGEIDIQECLFWLENTEGFGNLDEVHTLVSFVRRHLTRQPAEQDAIVEKLEAELAKTKESWATAFRLGIEHQNRAEALKTALAELSATVEKLEAERDADLSDEERIAYWRGAYERMAARNVQLSDAISQATVDAERVV